MKDVVLRIEESRGNFTRIPTAHFSAMSYNIIKNNNLPDLVEKIERFAVITQSKRIELHPATILHTVQSVTYTSN